MERRQFLIGAGATAMVASRSAPLLAASPSDAALNGLMDRIFRDGLLLSPQRASSLGLDKGPRAQLKGRLDDYGAGQRFVEHDFKQKALAQLQAVSSDGLSAAGLRNRENAIYMFGQQLVADPCNLT